MDRLEPFTTPTQLAVQLDLPVAPVTALGAVAGADPCLLLIDQLDAVSFASGRLPRQLEPILELLEQAKAFPAMKVVLACRQYDLDNDSRLGALVADDGPAVLHTIGALSDEQIDVAVGALGLDARRLAPEQRALLSSPLHLVLLSTIADEVGALQFRTTNELLDRYYDRKERDCQQRKAPAPVRFGAVVGALADAMSARQRLSIPRPVLDDHDLRPDIDVLASEQVIVADGPRLAFFHEAFFDHVFARRWVAREELLRDWLLEGEQELFRRAQVRQVLLHLRDLDPDRFVAELRRCLGDENVRVHIRDVMFAVLGALPDPSPLEWNLVSEICRTDGWAADRAWGVLRSPEWFARADSEGALAMWLSSGDPTLRARALEIMAAGSAEHADRAAALFELLDGREEYGHALLWTFRRPGMTGSRAVVDLTLAAVRAGALNDRGHELFLGAGGFAEARPEWACELIHAWLAQRPGSMEVAHGHIVDLQSNDHGLLRILISAADGAPVAFARLMIPYMLGVARTCAYRDDGRPIPDWHFSDRADNDEFRYAGEALQFGMAAALRRIGAEHRGVADDLAARLLAEPYETAQWLAYQLYIGAGASRAEEVADILLQAPSRLNCGYRTGPCWTTRELLLAIAEKLDDERVALLEDAVLRLPTDGVDRVSDYGLLTLLTGLPEQRLSGAAAQRLAELREHFGTQQPDPPTPGVIIHERRAPLDAEQAAALSDEQWLAAMREHAADDSRHSDSGADELALVLADQVKLEPARFAELALRINRSYDPTYLSSILQALAEPSEYVPAQTLHTLVRHAATLAQPELDRWIGWPLHSVVADGVPDDIVAVLLHLARHGSPPPNRAVSSTASFNADPRRTRHQLRAAGINTVRGQAIRLLTRLLGSDENGRRTQLVAPSFDMLAEDSALAVRAMTAELMTAGLRHARPAVVAALAHLLDGDDALLAEGSVQTLLLYIGDNDVALVLPLINRMLAGSPTGVREGGGRLAAYAALEWQHSGLLTVALAGDANARRGAALVCARRLPFAGDASLATGALVRLFDDEDAGVRAAAAEVVGALRDEALQPFRDVLVALIASPAFTDALAQLTITLERAPDDIGELLALTVSRLLETSGGDVRSIASGAAADARHLGELVLRWYARAGDPETRRRALNVLDAMLSVESHGVAELLREAER